MKNYTIKYNEQNVINKYESVLGNTFQEALTKFYILHPDGIVEGVSFDEV